MEILGIGGWEIVAILLLLLIVAGPKRMIAWSYELGRYLAVIRNMWAEAAAMLQKELRQAGVDVEIPVEPPTRGSVTKMITTTVNKAVAPIADPIKETQQQLGIKDLMGPSTPRTLNKPVTPQTPPPALAPAPANGKPAAPTATTSTNGTSSTFGAWGSTPSTPPPSTPDSAMGDDGGFGTWGGSA